MPNHLHGLIVFRHSDKSIKSVIGNGKRFTAYEIVKRLELNGEDNTLNKLMEGVSIRDYKRGKLEEVYLYAEPPRRETPRGRGAWLAHFISILTEKRHYDLWGTYGFG